MRSPGGPPPPILSPLATAKFWSRVAIPSDFQCWEWQGKKNDSGYGRVTGAMAHRVAYQLFNGPVPDDILIRHRCDNPGCCNPRHMLLGTNLDNMGDAVRRKRTARGRGHVNTRISERDAAYIKANPDRLTLRALAERFGIAVSTCSYIRSGRSWKYLEAPR